MDLHSPNAARILGTLALLAIIAGAWFAALGPQVRELSETRAAIDDTRSQNDVLRGQLATLVTQERMLDATLADDRALGRLFPPTADQPGLFRQVSAAADDAGIPPSKITTLAPTAPALGATGGAEGASVPGAAGAGDLARQTVSITVEADYARTQRLLEGLEEMPRSYLVSTLSVGAGSAPGTFLTSIAGDMFVMPPAPRP